MAKSKSKKQKGGRPKGETRSHYKLTDRAKQRIIEALIIGEPLEIAARRGRIDRMTLYRWRKEGEKLYKAQLKGKKISEQDQPLIDLYGEIEDALIESEMKAARAIDTGFTGIKTQVVEEKFDKVTGNLISRKTYDKYLVKPDWRAAESKLARRYPDRWGNKEKITHKDNPDKPIVATTLRDFVLQAARKQKELKEQQKEWRKGNHVDSARERDRYQLSSSRDEPRSDVVSLSSSCET